MGRQFSRIGPFAKLESVAKKNKIGAALLALTLSQSLSLTKPTYAQAPPTPLKAGYSADLLGKESLSAASRHFQNDLDGKDRNGAAFALGIGRFLMAVEGLGQDLYKYGFKPVRRIAFMSLVIGVNPNPRTITYKEFRLSIERFLSRLGHSLQALELIDGDVKVRLHFGKVRLDLNGDGVRERNETLYRVYCRLMRQEESLLEASAEQFEIAFDRADVHWLKGYCHLLSGICESLLAYDSSSSFALAAPIFFSNSQLPTAQFGEPDIFDFVGLVHTISWPLMIQESNLVIQDKALSACPVPPKAADFFSPSARSVSLNFVPVGGAERLRSAHSHFLTVVKESRLTWKYSREEVDDDCEWLPNPKQTGVIPGVRVTEEMINTWMSIMSEGESLLLGEKLIPFWRDFKGQSKGAFRGEAQTGYGINLKRFFLEPRKFDLVLLVQGSDAVPYIEHGRLSRGRQWRTWLSEFGPDFPGFAAWFN
ncbi:MAG: hypothetical protein J0M35_21305 [Candidatus Obscuribacter phosphatis]|uniref:Uncharacterized protein n=1 Tax=Candidatus Obscuribacter phosphatis TaxID=1906157 RepID=A0A8J7PIV4_9BACT|nr:hypothetical protein [Candidatus Obscuribacter phosphatis]